MSTTAWIIIAIIVVLLLALAVFAMQRARTRRLGQRRVEARARFSEAGRLQDVAGGERTALQQAEATAAHEHEQADLHLQRAQEAEHEAEGHRERAREAELQAGAHEARAERVDPDR